MACGTEAGVFRVKPDILIVRAVGRYATVFQAEEIAIKTSDEENMRMDLINREMCIFLDIQAALKALTNFRTLPWFENVK